MRSGRRAAAPWPSPAICWRRGRGNEAVEACFQAAEEAERSVAFREAAELLERVLPHVSDPRERARLLLRMGRLRWYNGEPAAAEQLLADAVEQLEELGLPVEAAQARVYLGRSQWELDKSDDAMEQFEHAREALEREGPSADLALAYLRIAGIHAFQLEYEQCLAAAERAVEIAEQASADFERVYALSIAALGHYGTAREFTLLDECFHEALAKGYVVIASAVLYNEIWDRVHAVAGGLAEALEKQEPLLFHIRLSAGGEIARAWALIELGAPREALELALRAGGPAREPRSLEVRVALSARGHRGTRRARTHVGGGRRSSLRLRRRTSSRTSSTTPRPACGSRSRTSGSTMRSSWAGESPLPSPC